MDDERQPHVRRMSAMCTTNVSHVYDVRRTMTETIKNKNSDTKKEE